ncbi:MAG: hypothetical protein IT297_07565 [Anaerolineae bacterium]|nr:hypothetical protein [Anaerolineae bacterium]MCZ7553492.1 hypothetical protein [Anaerolineales bacterium]
MPITNRMPQFSTTRTAAQAHAARAHRPAREGFSAPPPHCPGINFPQAQPPEADCFNRRAGGRSERQ